MLNRSVRRDRPRAWDHPSVRGQGRNLRFGFPYEEIKLEEISLHENDNTLDRSFPGSQP